MSIEVPLHKAGDLPSPQRSRDYIDLDAACVIWTEGKTINVRVYNIIGGKEDRIRIFRYIDRLEDFMGRRKYKILNNIMWREQAACRNARILLDCKIRSHK